MLMLGSVWGYRGPGWCSVLQCLSCLPLHNCVQQTHFVFNCLFCNDMVLIYAREKPNGLHVQKCEKILIWLHKYSVASDQGV
jgi:hypothetical protein